MLTWRPPCPHSRHPGSATGPLYLLASRVALYSLPQAAQRRSAATWMIRVLPKLLPLPLPPYLRPKRP